MIQVSGLSAVVKYGDTLHRQKMIVRVEEVITLKVELSTNINIINGYIDDLNVLSPNFDTIKIIGSNMEKIKIAEQLKQHLNTILTIDIHSLN